jgi:putative DNA primase/helicase
LSTFPDVLKGIRRLSYVENDRFLGQFPAMVAPVVGPDGKLRSVHRTYLGDVPTRKKLLSQVGAGAAIRLFKPTHILGIAEGIETAIAAYELFGIPTWATISTAIMETFEPPQASSTWSSVAITTPTSQARSQRSRSLTGSAATRI